MSFDYFNGKKWKDISRDERRFCADLIFQLQNNNSEHQFVEWLVEINKLDIPKVTDFEIDFEVCFYRDMLFDYELRNKATLKDKKKIKGLLKRTFDICIFLPNDIIIIEAKAAQGMTSNQMIEFKYDKRSIQSCLGDLGFAEKTVYIIGLVSSEYSTKTIVKLNKEHRYFDGIISWQDIENKNGLKYTQPDKLRRVYSETSLRKTYSQKEHQIIDHLVDLTGKMENERKTLKNTG